MSERSEGIDYSEWIGGIESAEDTATLAPVRGLLATLDDGGTTLAAGDPLPPLWHWLYFLPRPPASGIGADGHPRRGGFMPPVSLPRRMFAGAQVEFRAPIRIGAALHRRSEITGVAEKSGKSGRLVFVTVRHEITADGVPAVSETQNIVYREAGAAVAAPEVREAFPPAPEGAWVREVRPDPVLLFRFSALTFNGHRIHYDRSYATGEEHYPGLVVHGPLLATLLADLVRLNSPRRIARFEFRALAPVFDTGPFRLVGRPEGERVALVAERCDGAEAMRAEAVLAET